MLWVRDKHKECKRERESSTCRQWLSDLEVWWSLPEIPFSPSPQCFTCASAMLPQPHSSPLSLCIAVILILDTTPSLFSPCKNKEFGGIDEIEAKHDPSLSVHIYHKREKHIISLILQSCELNPSCQERSIRLMMTQSDKLHKLSLCLRWGHPQFLF